MPSLLDICGLGDTRGLGVGFALVAFQQRTACSRLGRRTGSLGAEWPLFQGGGHAQQGAPPGWWKVKTGKCYDKKCLVSSKIGEKQIKSHLAINQRQQNMSKVLGVQIVNNMLIYIC